MATKICRVIAQFRSPMGLPRPEGPRQSLRSGSRSDSFWGSGQGGCTEMHYSPRIWQKRGPELALLFPCLSSPPLLLPFLPFSARGPGSQGGRRFVTMAHNRLLLYSAFDDDQPLPIYRYRKWSTAGDCTPVGHRCTSLHSVAETPYGSSPCVRQACHPTTCPQTAQRFSTPCPS